MTATATVLCPEQTYEKFKRLIHHLVYKFQKRFGGDFHELLSEAHWHFLQACHSYIPRKSKPITHIYHCVWNGLRNTLRPKSYLRYAPQTIQREDARLEDLPGRGAPSPSPFSLSRLLERVSDDARTIIRLALAVEGRAAGVRRRRLIGVLRDLGCPAETVLASFAEIREALAG